MLKFQLSDGEDTTSTTESKSLGHSFLKKTTGVCLCSNSSVSSFQNSSPSYFDIVRDVRQNKGSILKASVEYIKKLKVDQDRKKYLEEKSRLQEYQNKKLLLKLQVQ